MGRGIVDLPILWWEHHFPNQSITYPTLWGWAGVGLPSGSGPLPSPAHNRGLKKKALPAVRTRPSHASKASHRWANNRNVRIICQAILPQMKKKTLLPGPLCREQPSLGRKGSISAPPYRLEEKNADWRLAYWWVKFCLAYGSVVSASNVAFLSTLPLHYKFLGSIVIRCHGGMEGEQVSARS